MVIGRFFVRSCAALGCFFIVFLAGSGCENANTSATNAVQIRTIELVLTPQMGGEETVYTWKNLEGAIDTQPQEASSISLVVETSYRASLRFYNAEASASTSVNAAIRDQASKYLILVMSEGMPAITYQLTDADENGNDLGLSGALYAPETGSGQVRVLVLHDVNTKDISGGIDQLGGTRVADVRYQLSVLDRPDFSVSQHVVELGGEAGTLSVPINMIGQGDLSIQRPSNALWITRTNVNEEESQATLVYTRNETASGRRTTLKLSLGERIRHICLIQQTYVAAVNVRLSQRSLRLRTNESAEYTVSVTASAPWTIKQRQIDKSWLSATKVNSPNSTGSSLRLSLLANASEMVRNGEVQIISEGQATIFPVSQGDPQACNAN